MDDNTTPSDDNTTPSVDADSDRDKLLNLARTIEAIKCPQRIASNNGGVVVANAMACLEDVADYIRRNIRIDGQ